MFVWINKTNDSPQYKNTIYLYEIMRRSSIIRLEMDDAIRSRNDIKYNRLKKELYTILKQEPTQVHVDKDWNKTEYSMEQVTFIWLAE